MDLSQLRRTRGPGSAPQVAKTIPSVRQVTTKMTEASRCAEYGSMRRSFPGDAARHPSFEMIIQSMHACRDMFAKASGLVTDGGEKP